MHLYFKVNYTLPLDHSWFFDGICVAHHFSALCFMRVCVLFLLCFCVFFNFFWVYIGFCFVFVLCLVSLLFPMSLDCPFFSVSSVFSNVYLQFIIFLHNYPNVIIDVYWLTSQNWCIIYVISFYLPFPFLKTWFQCQCHNMFVNWSIL